MKIESVIRKTVIVINGVEHLIGYEDWTRGVQSAQQCEGKVFKSDKNVIDFVETIVSEADEPDDDKDNVSELIYTTDDLYNANPECNHHVVSVPGGGVKCNKCDGWFCY